MRLINGRGSTKAPNTRAFLFSRFNMDVGHFYYIKDSFYENLPNCGLMTNKKANQSGQHNRPCHYCFECDGFYWMVPVSSQVAKYQAICDSKVKKYGKCNTIAFDFVNGYKRAFLIQNAFPTTLEYIDSEYMVNHNTIPVVAKQKTVSKINALLRNVIRLHNNGINITLMDLDRIISFLSK